jgi:hypothetical protein
MGDVLRKSAAEIETLKQKLSQAEFDLKETRYELAQSMKKNESLNEEKKQTEQICQSRLNDFQLRSEKESKQQEDRMIVIGLESDQACKILMNFLETTKLQKSDTLSKTMTHLMQKAIAALEKIKLATASNSNMDIRIQSSAINREVLLFHFIPIFTICLTRICYRF